MRGLVVTILIALAWQARAQIQSPVQVTTGKGTLVGYHLDLGHNSSSFYTGSADVFLGIPFAHPPVGPLRFKKPVSLSTYGSPPLNVTTNKPACPQAKEDLNINEDCLYLNVFTPSVSSTKKLPVMVYIYGGSLQEGHADYSPQAAIKFYTSKEVVFVNIQYRVSLLGFFTTHTDEFPANLGMLDQVEALKWIKSEISAFGGDPTRVTLIGQSAGAASISAHTYSPLSKDLFHGAIQHSGGVESCFDGARGFLGSSELRALQLCNFTRSEWELRNYSRLHSCLMTKTWKELVSLDKGNFVVWMMSQDNFFMPDVPRNLASQRKQIPVLVGSVIDEYALHPIMLVDYGHPLNTTNRTTFNKYYDYNLGYYPPVQRALVKTMLEGAYKVNEAVTYVDWLRKISDLFTVNKFVGPMLHDIRDHFANGNGRRVFVYQITHQSGLYKVPSFGNWKPVVHASDIPYFNPDPEVWLNATKNGQVTLRDLEIHNWMSESWTNFAKTGRPTPDWITFPHGLVSPHFPIPYLEISSTGNFNRLYYRYEDEAVWSGTIPQIVGIEPPPRQDYNNGSVYQPHWQPSLI